MSPIINIKKLKVIYFTVSRHLRIHQIQHEDTVKKLCKIYLLNVKIDNIKIN